MYELGRLNVIKNEMHLREKAAYGRCSTNNLKRSVVRVIGLGLHRKAVVFVKFSPFTKWNVKFTNFRIMWYHDALTFESFIPMPGEKI